MSTCPVIPRIVTASALRYGWPTPVFVELFLPEDPVNAGNIACWDGCHNEASLDYYRASSPPRTEQERTAADRAVSAYRSWMASIPADAQQTIVRVERRPRRA